MEPEVYEGELVERENVFYKPNSLEPFDGENIQWYEKCTYLDLLKLKSGYAGDHATP